MGNCVFCNNPAEHKVRSRCELCEHPDVKLCFWCSEMLQELTHGGFHIGNLAPPRRDKAKELAVAEVERILAGAE